MQLVKCLVHGLFFYLPTNDEEYNNRKFHEEIKKCEQHQRDYPQCKLINISGSRKNKDLCECGHAYEYHFPEGCISGHCPCKQDNRENEK